MAVAASAVAVTALAACGGSDGGSGGSGSASGESCTNEIVNADAPQVSVWAWYPAFEQVVDNFNETNDDVQICWTNAGQGADEYTKFSTALEAGSGAPDVIMLEAEVLSTFTIRDGLVDLSEYGAGELEGEFTEGAWSDVTNGDAIYAVPVDGGPMGMLYREDIFAEYGVEVPTTWEEFATAAQALKDAGYEGYITNFPTNGNAFIHALMAQKGWEPFTYDAAAPTEIGIAVDTEPAQEVLSYWEGLVDEGLVSTDEAFTADYNTSLVDGTYAVYLAAAWGPGYLQGLSDADEEATWRAAPIPQWEGEEPTQINWGGSTFAVTSQADDPELAAQVAMGIFGTEEAWDIGIEEAALFPLWKPVLESDGFATREYEFFDGQQIQQDVFLEAASGYQGFTFAPFQTYVYDQQTQQLFAMVEGSVDSAGALAGFEKSLVDYATAQGFTVTE
ncbi:ABC transporter substrate-binding protein [Cellulomonas carbonis]|uniref:ABC transporter substrate-binding protein n=1 Tax=Cellulomonas carbonis T26 TaxID=947969 RepID=A0A0A0BVU1_9CELL|nr:extracellular solute-binding protein [Cellulomonas carbonis]KGM11777.1 ABC transporter substrate-binding protein [Cellulomonas carbonis T26]